MHVDIVVIHVLLEVVSVGVLLYLVFCWWAVWCCDSLLLTCHLIFMLSVSCLLTMRSY